MIEVSDETKDVLERFIRGFNKKPIFPEDGDCETCDEFFQSPSSSIYGHLSMHFITGWRGYCNEWIEEYGLDLEKK